MSVPHIISISIPWLVFGAFLLCTFASVACILLALLLRAKKQLRMGNTVDPYAQSLIDSIQDLSWVKDASNRFLMVNAKFCEVFGVTRECVVGKTDAELSGGQVEQFFQGDKLAGNANESVRFEQAFSDSKGAQKWAVTTKVPVVDAKGAVIGSAATSRDVTNYKESEKYIEHVIYHDPLTNLPNRVSLERKLDTYLRSGAFNDTPLAVCFLDLDNFKFVNDSFGHSEGDKILSELADRLQNLCEGMDFAARIGGDEFVMVLANTHSRQECLEKVSHILSVLSAPVEYSRLEVDLTVSIGVAFYAEAGNSCWQLVRNADLAMYEAKKIGKNCYHVFTPEIAARSLKQRTIERRIKAAVENEEFFLCYQPVYDYSSQRIAGLEALVRWDDPANGLIRPDEFIPAAEATGYIQDLGNWVFRKALQDAKVLQQRYDPELKIAINVSAVQVRQPGFADNIIREMEAQKFRTNLVELEITESVVVDHAEIVVKNLEKLRAKGVKVSVDDFGTGYSNLSYLSKFPIDTMKIDRAFVRDIYCRKDNLLIASAIVQLADSFGLKVIAEGVEVEEEARRIAELGVTLMQGFYFDHPLTFEKLETLLSEQYEAQLLPYAAV